ncbi:MAG TPA: 2-phosphosulfolactate phosphatase [Candidatus Acidoferrum sp.]|nr:2-phosphosulfolactate phosphatase [Candidatus Acidoferrum sp.]
MKLEVVLSPNELSALAKRDLQHTVCVVFDVLRATSTIVTALHNGAKAVIPVAEISEALEFRRKQPDLLLGGERDGVRIRAAQTGSVDFDLGNSPREYTPERVRGKTIVSTTTNGTRALRACAGAKTVLAASFLNLAATAKCIQNLQPAELLLVCAGTRENVATEDVLAAGALAEMLASPLSMNRGRADLPVSLAAQQRRPAFGDSAVTALDAWRKAEHNLPAAVSEAENARRLLAIPGLRDDVAFCLQRDIFNLTAALERDGVIRISV